MSSEREMLVDIRRATISRTFFERAGRESKINKLLVSVSPLTAEVFPKRDAGNSTMSTYVDVAEQKRKESRVFLLYGFCRQNPYIVFVRGS